MFVTIDPVLLRNRDVIVVAPTGSGKTTASIRAARELVPREYRQVVFLEPTKALMSEVHKRLVSVFGDAGIDNSDAKLDPRWRFAEEWRKPAVVTSYERFDALITKDVELLKDRIVVIDEAHHLTEPDRATALINIMAVVRMAREELGYRNRLVLLSATMPDVEGLRDYLDAEVIAVKKRPTRIVVEERFAPVFSRGARSYFAARYPVVVEEVAKSLKSGYRPVLVYVPSRRYSEEFAEIIEAALGVKTAVFHAGVPREERERLLADLSKPNPETDVVVATDTLTHGVNLAFGAVIVAWLKRFTPTSVELVPPERVAQVIGRAARPGYRNEGRAVIIISDDMERSVAEMAKKGIYRGIAEPGDYPGLVLRLVRTGRSPEVWARYAYGVDRERIASALEVLRRIGFIRDDGELHPLAAVLADDYVSSWAWPEVYAASKAHEVKEHPLRVALGYAALIAYAESKLWTRTSLYEKAVEKEGFHPRLSEELRFATVYAHYSSMYGDEAFNALAELAATQETRGHILDVPEVYIAALDNPHVINIDTELESVRRAATIVADVVSDEKLARHAKLAAKILQEYRSMLLRVKASRVAGLLTAMLMVTRKLEENGIEVKPGHIEIAAVHYASLAPLRNAKNGFEARDMILEAAEKIAETITEVGSRLAPRPKLQGRRSATVSSAAVEEARP